MNIATNNKTLLVAACLAALVAALLVGSRFFQPFGYAALPFCLPGLCILGADETQEAYGYWGEIVLLWVLSLPCLVLYASLVWSLWRYRAHPPHPAA